MKSVQGSTPLEPLAAVCISRGPLGAVSEQSRADRVCSMGLWPGAWPQPGTGVRVEPRQGDKAGRWCRLTWCEPKSSEAWRGNM